MSIGKKKVGLSEIEQAITSNHTQRLAQEDWPGFIARIPGVTEVYGVRHSALQEVSSDLTDVSNVAGNVDVVREDSVSGVFKSYRFLYVVEQGGVYSRVGPFKDLDYGHHRTDAPALAEDPMGTKEPNED